MSKNKVWLIVIIIVLILVISYFIWGRKSVEYAELRDQPHLLGDPESSIVLVEYSDFQCPACNAAHYLVKDLVAKYQDKIRFEYRHFPLTSIHPRAFKAAEASECAADQNKFWEYHDLLFTNQESLSNSDLELYAGQVDGLDLELFGDCLASRVKSERVKEDLAEANLQGFNSTPTFILNGQRVENWQTLPSLIESLLVPLVPLNEATTTDEVLEASE